MKVNERRATAAALASSLSIVASLGLARALDVTAEETPGQQPSKPAGSSSRRVAANGGPSGIVIVRRTKPVVVAGVPASNGPVYVAQAPAASVSLPAAPAPAPVAPAPIPQPVSRSS